MLTKPEFKQLVIRAYCQVSVELMDGLNIPADDPGRGRVSVLNAQVQLPPGQERELSALKARIRQYGRTLRQELVARIFEGSVDMTREAECFVQQLES